MSWPKAIAAWLLIVIAESVHGTLRQLLVVPLLGDLQARQLGVLVGSAIVLAIAWMLIRWINAKSLAEQFQVGLLWVALMVIFEVSLGRALGYSPERILSDYNMSEGGFMAFGLLLMLFAPALAARVRGFGPNRAASRTREHVS